MATYQFRKGCRISGDAAAVAAEMERIRTERGALQPEAIVETASAEESPLHSFFDWDDASAAHEHRLVQARRLVRAIVVVTDNREPVSMYVHVTQEAVGQGDYERLAIVARQPDRYLLALTEARRDLASAQRRVAELLDAAKAGGAKKGEVARIMLAVQALETANEAIHALH